MKASYSKCPHSPQCDYSDRGECIAKQAKERKRTKQVFSTGEIPHLWAHKVQDSARNAQGNLYFNGDTIYSYGSHFPIARHIENKSGERAILFTTDSYSNTTAKHIGCVRGAIPHDTLIFHTPGATRDTAQAIAHWTKEIEDNLRKSARARNEQGRSWSLGRANELRQEGIKYGKFFGVKVKLPQVSEAIVNKLLPKLKKQSAADAQVTRAANKIRRINIWTMIEAYRDGNQDVSSWEIRAMLDKLPAETRAAYQAEHEANAMEWLARRNEAIKKENAEKIAQWIKGEDVYIPRNLPFALLRVNGEDVETSQGARVPIEHAKRALKFVRGIVKNGEDWKANGHTFHVGHYAVERIEANGTLHAGCHVIEYSEIERIAPQLA